MSSNVRLEYSDGRGGGVEIIAAIEYQQTPSGEYVPGSVVTVREGKPNWVATHFDCDWCQKFGVVYASMSGFGGNGLALCPFVDRNADVPIWFDRDLITPCTNDLESRPLSDDDLRGMGYKVISEPLPLGEPGHFHPLQGNSHYSLFWGQTVYCSVCKDSMPSEDWYLCEHIFWCEKHGVYGGEGIECGGCECAKPVDDNGDDEGDE